MFEANNFIQISSFSQCNNKTLMTKKDTGPSCKGKKAAMLMGKKWQFNESIEKWLNRPLGGLDRATAVL